MDKSEHHRDLSKSNSYNELDLSTLLPILNLPLEIQLEIIDHLDFPENIRLKLTCTHFYNIIEALTLDKLRETQASSFAIRRHLHGCRTCGRLRRKFRFLYCSNEVLLGWREKISGNLFRCNSCWHAHHRREKMISKRPHS
jgi:hypothetical protein